MKNRFYFCISQDYYLESHLGNLEGGVKFQVHPKNVPHDIESLGVSVGSAMQASVDIRKNVVSLFFLYFDLYMPC